MLPKKSLIINVGRLIQGSALIVQVSVTLMCPSAKCEKHKGKKPFNNLLTANYGTRCLWLTRGRWIMANIPCTILNENVFNGFLFYKFIIIFTKLFSFVTVSTENLWRCCLCWLVSANLSRLYVKQLRLKHWLREKSSKWAKVLLYLFSWGRFRGSRLHWTLSVLTDSARLTINRLKTLVVLSTLKLQTTTMKPSVWTTTLHWTCCSWRCENVNDPLNVSNIKVTATEW